MINVGCIAGLQLEKDSKFNISSRALNHKTIFNIFPFKVSIGIGPPTKDIRGSETRGELVNKTVKG